MIHDLTVSLEIAKKLKEAGWKKETLLAYHAQDKHNLCYFLSSRDLPEYMAKSEIKLLAPTAGELLRELDVETFYSNGEPIWDGVNLKYDEIEKEWDASYQDWHDGFGSDYPELHCKAETCEDALALLWIKLNK